MDNERRSFLNITAGIIVSIGLPLFAHESKKNQTLGNGFFLHGIASGDPLQDKVVIWTRVTPDTDINSISVIYEISHDINFTKIYRLDYAVALKEHDYTLKIDLQGLEADTQYFYRFKTENSVSAIGKTRTLPKTTNKVTLAVFSCANYTSGYFNAYHDACSFNQIDVVVHLGDYIYEYGMLDEHGKDAYGTKNAQNIGRVLPKNNSKELLNLEDYRLRYALYRSDPDLQKLHANFPFICIWDDHEVADDAYSYGISSNNQTLEKYLKRKQDAIKAYYEWLPIRPPLADEYDKIYRAFHFGTLFSLYMLDTRLFARDKQLDYQDYVQTDGSLDLKQLQTDLENPKRELLGKSQFSWLKKELEASSTQWQILAQQIKMSPSFVPLETIELLTKYNNAQTLKEKKLFKEQLITAFYEIGHIKARDILKDPELTLKEKKRLQISLPHNLDAWDGYSKEREKLYSILKQHSDATVILSGDAHYSWSSRLVDESNEMIGVELGVTSVSSPGIEEIYDLDGDEILESLEQGMPIFNPNSLYNNQIDRGYLIVEIEQSEIKAHWRYVNTVNSRDYHILQNRNSTMRISSKDGKYYYRVH